MQRFKLLDRCKISVQRPWVGRTVHAGQVWRLIVGPGIGKGAGRRRARRHVAEGVDEVRQFTGHTILLQVRNVVTSVIDTPLFEVSSDNLALITVLCE